MSKNDFRDEASNIFSVLMRAWRRCFSVYDVLGDDDPTGYDHCREVCKAEHAINDLVDWYCKA